jgi:competence protein ComFB
MLNALEAAALDAYEELRSSEPTFCGCQRCREDVLALVLNQAHPRYVVGDPLGAAVTRVALTRRQLKVELSVIVLAAIRRVAAAPHHTREERGSSH